MTAWNFQRLALIRLREAKALLKAGCPDGAHYLAGYAVECALKACIAKQTRRYEFPDKRRAERAYTHSIRDLVKEARWEERIKREHAALLAGVLVDAIQDRREGVLPWIKRSW